MESRLSTTVTLNGAALMVCRIQDVNALLVVSYGAILHANSLLVSTL